jgi:hypothetical protein
VRCSFVEGFSKTAGLVGAAATPITAPIKAGFRQLKKNPISNSLTGLGAVMDWGKYKNKMDLQRGGMPWRG